MGIGLDGHHPMSEVEEHELVGCPTGWSNTAQVVDASCSCSIAVQVVCSIAHCWPPPFPQNQRSNALGLLVVVAAATGRGLLPRLASPRPWTKSFLLSLRRF